ncbi:MAG: type II toxin-antitoxin system VapB family antitoxin [Verrucomicrobia bacterium]|nr:type II toxin-antitoxin system VapB family antitoxin [Verrucomicrobiota bacterium]
MKLTVNLDGEVLDRVVKITGSSTKTEAIMKALKEIERKARLVEVLREGLGASETELKSMFDPASAPAREK